MCVFYERERTGMIMSQTTNDSLKSNSEDQKDIRNVCVDSFYSESNMAHLRRGIAALNAGEGKEHEVSAEEDNTAVSKCEDRPAVRRF